MYLCGGTPVKRWVWLEFYARLGTTLAPMNDKHLTMFYR